jgi:RNase H-fold protein (predicted Holliday junction resolvase)
MEVVLGLDISTSKIGITIMNYDMDLIHCEFLKLNSKKELEDRCMDLENHIVSLSRKHPIKQIFIEQPFVMFSGGKTTAMTMSKLQRFNGMCSYMVRRLLGINPELIAANKARSLNEIKVKRGQNTKKIIIEWVANKYPKDFVFDLTRYGNPKPGTDDKADSVVIALAGLIISKKK